MDGRCSVQWLALDSYNKRSVVVAVHRLGCLQFVANVKQYVVVAKKTNTYYRRCYFSSFLW